MQTLTDTRQARAASEVVRALLRRVARALTSIIGAPDYERYLEHVRRAHPERPPLGRDDFVRQRLRARYDRPGSRCC
jgi:uncharacterized short protein YbdD (DUF466 family)